MNAARAKPEAKPSAVWEPVALAPGCRQPFAGPATTIAARCPTKTRFVSQDQRNGSLGGLSGGDNLCNVEAVIAGLPPTYKAWLSDGTTSAAARLTHATVPYKRIDGVTIADDWADLTDGTLDAPLDRDVYGNTEKSEMSRSSQEPRRMAARAFSTARTGRPPTCRRSASPAGQLRRHRRGRTRPSVAAKPHAPCTASTSQIVGESKSCGHLNEYRNRTRRYSPTRFDTFRREGSIGRSTNHGEVCHPARHAGSASAGAAARVSPDDPCPRPGSARRGRPSMRGSTSRVPSSSRSARSPGTCRRSLLTCERPSALGPTASTIPIRICRWRGRPATNGTAIEPSASSPKTSTSVRLRHAVRFPRARETARTFLFCAERPSWSSGPATSRDEPATTHRIFTMRLLLKRAVIAAAISISQFAGRRARQPQEDHS